MNPTTAGSLLAVGLESQRERLLPCVHCGFCLPACPTYNRLGDEADSPRGRLHLMRAVVDGRLDPASDAFQTHIDRCLGCRACEPVCPSGVEYGSLLELAREEGARHRPRGWLTTLLLRVFSSKGLQGAVFFGGRLIRDLGLASAVSSVLPRGGFLGSARLGLSMLAASAPWKGLQHGADPATPPGERAPTGRGRVALLTGCVQSGLYARVNAATVRVLEANGYQVVPVQGQSCCGALHAHAGDMDGARRLARTNVGAFQASDVDWIVVNAAGCGATMKEYGHLLAQDAQGYEAASAVQGRVRDLSELLAEAGPRQGSALPLTVAVDHPCHLLHAQRIEEEPLTMLAAVPGLEIQVVADASECCGGAGIYGITHPELGGQIGGDKVAAVRAASADVVATPNPGCMMQIGAGLRLAGATEGVVHPVELLDESYRRAGYYR